MNDNMNDNNGYYSINGGSTPPDEQQPGVISDRPYQQPSDSGYTPTPQYQQPNDSGYVSGTPYQQQMFSADPSHRQIPPQDIYQAYDLPKTNKKGNLVAKCAAAFLLVAGLSLCSIFAYSSLSKKEDDGSSISVTDDSSQLLSSAETSAASASSAEPKTTQSRGDGTEQDWIKLASKTNALTLPEIVDKAMPSVVGITATYPVSQSWGFQVQTYDSSSTGTGIIMSSDGYIITNAHVVTGGGAVTDISTVTASVILLSDDTEYAATIIGYDTQADIAVLKIDATGLTAAEFGNSDELVVGELAVAIGNPLGLQLSGSVTCGIISALNREINIDDRVMTLIQTDAAINSGNSGGPLINCYGQVIGINSAKMSSSYSSSSIEGLGFAIPMNEAQVIINDLINYGYVTGRPLLGITGVNVTETDASRYNLHIGVYVNSVTENGAADNAGIIAGDVIISANGTTITNFTELTAIIDTCKAGDSISLTIVRSGEEKELVAVLQEDISLGS